jgi:hypothetical protein
MNGSNFPALASHACDGQGRHRATRFRMEDLLLSHQLEQQNACHQHLQSNAREYRPITLLGDLRGTDRELHSAGEERLVSPNSN